MAEAVVGAVVGATIKVVLENLLSFPMEDISLMIWNLKKDLKKLKQSVITIRDFLEDAEAKQVKDKPLQRWLMKLEAVAFNADYVFDELNYHVLRRKVKREQVMKKKVSSFFSTSNPIVFRRRMAQKIKDIIKELKSINQEASELGLQMRIVGADSRGARTEASAYNYLESDSFAVDPVFVGRENDVTKIVEMVTSSSVEQVLSVLPIVGMGGLGKTTLSRKVYNESNIISHFGERIWVHVSENFDPVIVLKKTLESLTGENVDGSREVILRKLREKIGDKRYLLVLDNVWNEDREKWENFITSLEGISPLKGNVIMVTTRKRNVASIVNALGIHELGVLSKDDCWFIIKAKAFGGEGIPLEFETIGANIAERCGGLPLAAQVVGSLLRGKSKDEWMSIERNWLSDIGGDGSTILKILKLSFDNLPSPSVKKCFAFCSIIPKRSTIEKDEMIDLWMAEGFLQTHQEDMEIVGNRVFSHLIQSSLLQVWNRDDDGNVSLFVMHDLVHDLSLSILNSRYLDDTCDVRYIYKHHIDDSSPISKENAKCLRALFFKGKACQIMFSNFKYLHVLILVDKDSKEFPIEIGTLICLRYLDIAHTRIESLPDSIGNLYHLQTLRATIEHGKGGYLRKLPLTFEYLVNLRHLYIPNMKLPPKIGKLMSLQTLPYFQVHDDDGCGIMELGSLSNLKGELEIDNLEKVRDKAEAKSADLFHKPNILKLKLVWNESREGENNNESVLEGLQPHSNLKRLEINGFKGRSFALWSFRMEVRENLESRCVRLDNLLEIKLSGCEECEEIPMLGHLPNLKSLHLHRLSNVKSIGSSFYGIEENVVYKDTVIVFPALEKLELIDMAKLTAWADAELPSSESQTLEILVFGRLKYLKITNCRQLKSAPSKLPCLKELEIDNMESGLALANICGSKLTSLTKLSIVKVDGLVCLPNWLFSNNRDLLELSIKDCDNLTRLVPVPCLGLSSQGGFTSLRKLQISFCSSVTNLPIQMIESCAPTLERLWLRGSKSLLNLPQVMSILPKMPHLIGLTIQKVPKFSDVAAEIGCLRSLEGLGIGGASDCMDYVSFKDSLDRFFPTLQSLRELSLYGMEHWDALPDQLLHLSSTLQWLFLREFGIEALPEWLGNFSSLKKLELYNFQKLRSLASKKAMKDLTKLTTLRITNCPVLNLDEEASDGDSEWSKISHIPTIMLDGNLISASA